MDAGGRRARRAMTERADRDDAGSPRGPERAGDGGDGGPEHRQRRLRLSLGIEALAGLPLAFPFVMLVQMLSAGRWGARSRPRWRACRGAISRAARDGWPCMRG
jgi:hypothetical protein